MAEPVSDERRLEMVAMIASAYISAFNGPDMRPPDIITVTKFVSDLADTIDEKYPKN